MPKIKNKDGSINWDEIKINPVINTTWGSVNEFHKDAIDEIKAYVNKRYNKALEAVKETNKFYNYEDKVYNYEGMTRYARKLGRANMCKEILEFIDSITKL